MVKVTYPNYLAGASVRISHIGEGVMAGRGSWEAESVGGSFLFACGFLWHFSFTRIAIASELQVYLKLCYCNVFGSHYLFCVFIYFLFFNTGL